MRSYGKYITLTRNERGVYQIDPTIGCEHGMRLGPRGCYDDCYAAKSAKLYGYDFGKTVLRDFRDNRHADRIARAIARVDLPFVRMGCSGDPSEAWAHTVKVCGVLTRRIRHWQLDIHGDAAKPKAIVIITKHWHAMTDAQLEEMAAYGVIFNTSVSAVDSPELLAHRLEQHARIKGACKALLRVVSFDFNEATDEGARLAEVQRRLFAVGGVIDTVFRASRSNGLVKDGTINVKRTKFLGKNALVSKYNRKAFFGKCSSCLEMCGATM